MVARHTEKNNAAFGIRVSSRVSSRVSIRVSIGLAAKLAVGSA